MEVRCTTKDDQFLSTWFGPDFLFNISYYRAIPYDPARPWKEAGMWYMMLSTDACNGTTHSIPCDAGGSIELYSSPKLRGKGANWQHVL